MAVLTVACTNIGTKWHPVWVERLHRMVQDNCSVDFDFRVITNNPEDYPGVAIPLSRDIEWVDHVHQIDDPRMVLNRGKPQGCWGKLDAFLPTMGVNPVIHLDLDIVILDDIAPLARQTLHMPNQGNKFNGSVYSFTPSPEIEAIYPDRIPYSTHPRGEQEFVQESYPVKELPDCYSYKIHVASRYGRNPPEGARIIYHHGYPTPASESVQDVPWISRTWTGLTKVERI